MRGRNLGHLSPQIHWGNANKNSPHFLPQRLYPSLVSLTDADFPRFLQAFSHSTRNLGSAGVCTYTNHQTQRFQILPLERWTFKLKNHIWTETLLNRCIFSSLFTSIFRIKWIVVITSAIFSIHVSINCCEKTSGKGNNPHNPVIYHNAEYS